MYKTGDSAVKGYQIQYSTRKKFKSNNKNVLIKDLDKTSKKIRKLKSKTKYYVRIRTYKNVDGARVYSKWSAKKSVTTK